MTQPRRELPEIDERKLEVVREMLRNGFAGWAVEDAADELDRATRFFSVRQGREPRHRLSVSREFFHDHPIERIEPLLQSWRLVGALKQAGLRPVVVGSIGVHIGGCLLLAAARVNAGRGGLRAGGGAVGRRTPPLWTSRTARSC